MINPNDITRFDRTAWELEEFAIFSVLVAGKTAHTIAPRCDILVNINPAYMPLELIQHYIGEAELPFTLRNLGIGCYNQKAATLYKLARWVNRGWIKLDKCEPGELERIKGIGLKTSRFFILHSRPNQPYAALDRHIIRGMVDRGLLPNNTKFSTPNSAKLYEKYERIFIDYAREAGYTTAELDLQWWTKYSKQPAGIH